MPSNLYGPAFSRSPLSVPLKVQFLTVKPSRPALVWPPTEIPWPVADGAVRDEDVAAIGALRLGHDVVVAGVDVAVFDEKVAARLIDAIGIREIIAAVH